MSTDWVAASVRARSMAQRRLGAATCRTVAAQPTLAAGLALLAESVYGGRLAAVRADAARADAVTSGDDGAASRSGASADGGAKSRARVTVPPATPSLPAVEHALRATTLWQLRVLSGWLPVSGSRLARALAAEYEVENILALAARLTPGAPDATGATIVPEGPGSPRAAASVAIPPATTADPAYLDLGALRTAWPRARTAQTPEELAGVLRASRWGEIGTGSSSLRDILTLSRLGRLAAESLSARPWTQSEAGLLVARVRLVDQAEPSPRFRQLARPLVGMRWLQATTMPELRDALPHAARATLDGIDGPRDLWRAEARHHDTLESDALRLLRAALPGPDVVLGGVITLAVDAWRVRAALAAAATGRGASEVLDAVA